MDSFMNIAKKGYEAYNESQQSDVNKTGGQELNSPHHSSGSFGSDRPEIDNDQAIKTAKEAGSGDSSLFATALSFLSDNKNEHEKPLNDDEVTRAHDKVYKQNDTSGLSAKLLGSAAAMQVLKQFIGGGSSSSGKTGGNSQTQLISLAMAEATKLFDKSGSQASGNKQDVVNGAAMTVMKLLVQSKLGAAPTTGGSDSGGLGSLLSMASKLTK